MLVDKLRIKQIRVLFPLHQENLTAYFSPILGQYAIKNSDFIATFIEHFHRFTNNIFLPLFDQEATAGIVSFYDQELTIPLLVNIYKGGKFNLSVNAPSTGFLFSVCFKKRRRYYRQQRESFIPLRNYKKLLQIVFIKNSSSTFIATYKQIRNSLFQIT